MPLAYWDISEAKRLTEFYNQQIANIPYCYEVSAEEFQKGIGLESIPGRGDQDGESWREQLIVEEARETILGFIHLAIKTVTGDSPRGYIRFLSYECDHRQIGQQLLAASEQYFREAGVSKIDAFLPYEGYCFYHVGRGFVVDRWAHVYGLLGMNKYRILYAQVFMEKELVRGSKPTLPMIDVDLSSVIEVGQIEPLQVSVRLLQDGKGVGSCDACPVVQYQRSSEGVRQFYIPGLWIDDHLRGQGLGRYLVERLHWEMLKRGYDHSFIGTELNNYRAQLLYASDGYELLLTEYSFAKELK
ncbi:MAG: hypothetical protein CML07_08245 [Psychrobacter sp.]|nr:hypothetical protein [Psychrobacter sp.]